VTETLELLPAAALAACLAAMLLLALALRRERACRRAAEAALADHRAETAMQEERLGLLDRRRAALAPIEALSLAWARDCRPDEAALTEAARAVGEARLLFPAALAADLEEAAALLAMHARGRSWQRAAVEARRHEERADLFAEEIERERLLKPRIAELRQRLAEAARIPH
jgi:hypothetical protein